MKEDGVGADIRGRLVGLGGRVSQELGFSRIAGSILVYLYLSDGECSLDEIGDDLGLSKAAVSTSARQLETLGLLRRVWKKKDRRSYYRSADNIGTALQDGLLAFFGQKVQLVTRELETAREIVAKERKKRRDADLVFLEKRLGRAMELSNWGRRILGNRLLRMFVKVS